MKFLTLAATAGLALAHKQIMWEDRAIDFWQGLTWEGWVQDYTPRFRGTPEAFAANMEEIISHNSNPDRTWTAGVNQFTGLSREQFKSLVAGYNKGKKGRVEPTMMHDTSKDVHVSALPSTLDWRSKGVVTAVKDQGQCGGCWAFSTAETLESHIAINTGKLMTFSEQQIIDCTPNPDQCGGTGGCSGATQELGFNYTISAGITTEASYPYKARTDKCDTTKIKPVATITGYVQLPFNNYSALMNAVQVMPIAISAAAEPWQSYESGVFSTPCGTDVDHAIVLEGYGNDAATKKDYWLVRNSWSAGWGEKGYIRIARYGDTPQGEPCGEDKTPGDGDGCSGGPSTIKVCGQCGILSDSSYPTGGALAATE